MFKIAPPLQEYVLNKFGGLYLIADPRDLPGGASALCHDVDFSIAGVGIRPGLTAKLTVTAGTSGLWMKTTELYAGSGLVLIGTIIEDGGYVLWYEDSLNEGVLVSLYSGIINSARAISSSIDEMEYICLSDLTVGNDLPFILDQPTAGQVDLDKASQVGPGVGPQVSVTQPNIYPIQQIVEAYPSHQIWHIIWGAYMIDATPPPGNNIFFLFAPGATGNIKDLKVGDIVNVWGAAMSGTVDPSGTYRVATLGAWNSTKYGGVEEYFSVVAAEAVGQGSLTGLTTAYYEKTPGVIQLSSPIPRQDAVVGRKITVSGATPSPWNNTWEIQDVPSEGQLLITATSLSLNVATFTYSLVSGNAPGWQANHLYAVGAQIVDGTGHLYQVTVGGKSGAVSPAFGGGSPVTDNEVTWAVQSGVLPVTVFNCNNGNGIFNVQNAAITSATATTFTVAITSANLASAAEQGEAVSGSGSALVIDPGLLTLGTGHPGNNPIYGAAGAAGFVTPAESVDLAAGERYAICMFLTRKGYITPASPPVQFFTNGTTKTITFAGLPIGPSNVVIARIIAITAANAGVGGPYFYIPDDVILQSSEASLGAITTVNKTIVKDNSSTTTGALTITDTVLLNSINVTVPGNNVLQIREIAECVKVVDYAGRAFYMGERTKNDQLLNMTFDGGSVGGVPAGWTIDSGTATLTASTRYGQACVLNGTISQGAYQTAFKTPIIQPNVHYEVYIVAKGTGTVTIALSSGGSYTTPSLTASYAEYNSNGLFTNPLSQVPANARLTVTATGATIDRIEIYQFNRWSYVNQLGASYAQNPQSVDAITGAVDTSAFTSELITNEFRFLDTLYVTTLSKTFAVRDDGASEPSEWEIREISNTIGCFGPLAADVGEEFVVTADEKGVYIFDGGNHVKISQEIQPIWDALYTPNSTWKVRSPGRNVWIKIDQKNQRILVGVPLPTPNQWLPNAPTKSTPYFPNVILCCSYLGLPNGAAISEAMPVRPSPFTGHLLFRDGNRKWTIWQITSPHANWIYRRSTGVAEFWIGGNETGKIYKLDPTVFSDDGAVIKQRYQTFGFSDHDVEQQLQLGSVRKIFRYALALIEGVGNWTFSAYPETNAMTGVYVYTQPNFPLTSPAKDDKNIPMNVTGNRVFLDFQVDGVLGSYFKLRRINLAVARNPRIGVTGR